MFSVTGDLLNGTELRPDIYLIAKDEGESMAYDTTNAKLNSLGVIPVVSTASGFVRFSLGLVHTIVHLACAIFDTANRDKHLAEARLGMINVVRGLTEMIPVVGNLTLLMIDMFRIHRFRTQVQEIVDANRDAYRLHTTLFVPGQEIARCFTEQLNAALAEGPESQRTNQKTIEILNSMS